MKYLILGVISIVLIATIIKTKRDIVELKRKVESNKIENNKKDVNSL